MTQQILTRKACEFLMQTRFRAFCLTPQDPHVPDPHKGGLYISHASTGHKV